MQAINDYNTQRHGSHQKVYFDGIHVSIPVPVSLHLNDGMGSWGLC